MSAASKISGVVSEVAAKIVQLKEELKATIKALPDNPRIKRVSSNPNCFIIWWKDLTVTRTRRIPAQPAVRAGGHLVSPARKARVEKEICSDWSVLAHDFKRQYEYLAEEIDHLQPENIVPTFEKIIEKGWIISRGSVPTKVTFHPDVIEHLRKIIHGEA
jgi:hypothetical protein